MSAATFTNAGGAGCPLGGAALGGAAAGAAVGALSSAVDALVAVSPTGLPVPVLQEALAGVAGQADRLLGWLSTASGQLQAATGGQLPTADGRGRSVVGWLAEVTRTAPGTAGSRVRTAQALRSLPLVAEAVLDGVLTQEQAAVLSRLVGKIGPEELWETQPALIQVAAGRNPTELAAYVRHLIATHVEPVLEGEQAAGRAGRSLQTWREPDGRLRGRFCLPSEDSEAFLTVLEPLARRAGLGDDRSAAQRRADALVEICEQTARHGLLPDAGGARPQISYVLTADWAARQAEKDRCGLCRRCPAHRPVSLADTVTGSLPHPQHPAGDGCGAGGPVVPAELACATGAWSGPQTRARIEMLLCDARISRVLLDGRGQVRGLESLTDSVTPRQRRALAARDGGCAVRGCSRPPAFCDAHHLTARADGGPTTLTNLVLLCRRHHVLWHLGKISKQHLHLPWDTPHDQDLFAWSAPPPT